ncbi:MAG TPA: DUF2062 domain-containing protein [Terracidiphilus sp.]|nr:DUF2062 domain-containing protein [Terracidiphilus sp.]
MISRWRKSGMAQATAWLRTGISPQRLALTLALGFAIGCLPVIGIPTALCLMIALTLKLNVPVIQAANYAAMPLQIALMIPFVRLGGWMLSPGHQGTLAAQIMHGTASQMFRASGGLAWQALAAWLVIAGPAVLVMTLGLTPVLKRVRVVAGESRD